MRPPEADWPPPEKLACQLSVGSLLRPLDWNGPDSFTEIGCASCGALAPSTFAFSARLMFALLIGVLNALSIVALASSLLPPPQAARSAATSAKAHRERIARSGRVRGGFKKCSPIGF